MEEGLGMFLFFAIGSLVVGALEALTIRNCCYGLAVVVGATVGVVYEKIKNYVASFF